MTKKNKMKSKYKNNDTTERHVHQQQSACNQFVFESIVGCYSVAYHSCVLLRLYQESAVGLHRIISMETCYCSYFCQKKGKQLSPTDRAMRNAEVCYS